MPIQVSKLSTGIVQGLTVPFQKWLVNAVNQINTGASQNDVQNVTSQGIITGIE